MLIKVVSILRQEVGSVFLENTRLVIANCVRGVSFRLTYKQHFVGSGREGTGRVDSLYAFTKHLAPVSPHKNRNIALVAQSYKDTDERVCEIGLSVSETDDYCTVCHLRWVNNKIYIESVKSEPIRFVS